MVGVGSRVGERRSCRPILSRPCPGGIRCSSESHNPRMQDRRSRGFGQRPAGGRSKGFFAAPHASAVGRGVLANSRSARAERNTTNECAWVTFASDPRASQFRRMSRQSWIRAIRSRCQILCPIYAGSGAPPSDCSKSPRGNTAPNPKKCSGLLRGVSRGCHRSGTSNRTRVHLSAGEAEHNRGQISRVAEGAPIRATHNNHE